MGIGTSIFILALGAILTFAVDVVNTQGSINVHTVGVVLVIVGAAGLVGCLISRARRTRRELFHDGDEPRGSAVQPDEL
jgi:hypothetical protein